MKNFLLIIVVALASFSGSAFSLSEDYFSRNVFDRANKPANKVKQSSTVRENAPRKAGETYYDVKFNFVYDSESWTPYIMQYMMPVDGSYPAVGLCFGTDATFSVPAGNYDLLSIFISNEDYGCAAVVRENVEIRENAEFTFDTAEATQHIVYCPVMPDGSDMILPEWDSEQQKYVDEGNVAIANSAIQIDHRGWGNIFTVSVICFASPMRNTNVYTNAKEAFSFPFHVTGTSTDDTGCYIAYLEPDGCESQQVRNNPMQYTDFLPHFAGWMVSKDDKIDIWSTGVKSVIQTTYPETDNYTNSSFGVSNCNPSARVCLPTHNGKDKFVYYTLERQAGKWDNNFNFGINPPSIYFDESDDKLCCVSHFNCMAWGMGSISSNLFYYVYQEPASKPYLLPNETFSYPYSDDLVFGNSCPLWVPAWDSSTLHYGFIGRLGDVRSVDMVSHYISVKSNDRELVTGWEDLVTTYGKIAGVEKDAPLDIHVENRNLKIDNKKRIRGVADLHIVPNGNNASIPVIQMLQFRNAADDPTDRFAPEGSKMLIASGTFTDGGMYFEASELSTLTVEYAPSGTDAFENLPVTKGKEMPTYGWLYTSDMSGLDSKDDGWYDVRLRAEAPDGSTMTQLISPAFYLDKTLGINNINDVQAIEVKVIGRDIVADGNTEVYSVSGARCPLKSLTPGIYIVRRGDKAVKVTVK